MPTLPSRDALSFMKESCLRELEERVVKIPQNWRTVQVYDALVADGTAARVAGVLAWERAYAITEAGRERLRELALPNPPGATP